MPIPAPQAGGSFDANNRDREASSAVESKYERIYHASINPFTAWEQGEKDAAQDSLWMPERCLLTSAKWLLPSRPRRLGQNPVKLKKY